MIDLKAVQRVNNHPLNRAAGKWLPARLRNKDQINVLALAQWGLENGLVIKPPSPEQPVQEEVESRLAALQHHQPLKALRYFQEVEGETVLWPEQLAEQESRLDAANLLLESLYSNMVVEQD